MERFPQSEKLEKKFDAAAAFFRVIGYRKRLLVLYFLLEEEKSVGEIARATRTGHSAISQHLAALRRLDLLERRRVQQTVYYRVASAHVYWIVEFCRTNDLVPQPVMAAALLSGAPYE